MPKGAPDAKLTLEAWVETTKDSKRLNEYKVIHHPRKGKEPAYTECFLECVEGEAFRVRGKLNMRNTDDDLKVKFCCDGVHIAGRAVLGYDKKTLVTFDSCFDSQDGQPVARPLVFAPTITTDDGALAEVNVSLGTLEILFEEVKYRKATFGVGHKGSLQRTIVDEKQYKIGSTVVAGHSSKPVKPSQRYLATPKVDSQSYRFIFHYNTGIKLQTLSIIPQDRPEVRVPQDKPVQGPLATDLSGLEDKPGGVIAYENALKRILDLEADLRRERSRKRTRREKQMGDCIDDVVDLTDISD